jgi:hypothetical protein
MGALKNKCAFALSIIRRKAFLKKQTPADFIQRVLFPYRVSISKCESNSQQKTVTDGCTL